MDTYLYCNNVKCMNESYSEFVKLKQNFANVSLPGYIKSINKVKINTINIRKTYRHYNKEAVSF